MTGSSLADVEFVVRTIAQTAVDNEKYFGDLDAVVGDGDFGYSLARGFEIVLTDWDSYRPHRHRHVPEEDRRGHHQPDRRHLRADLGHGVPAGRRDGRRQDRTRPATTWSPMLRAADRGHHGPRQGGRWATRPCWTRSSRRPTPSRRRVRPAADGGRRSLAAQRQPRARRPRRPSRWRPSAAGPATPANAASGPSTPARWRWPSSPSRSPTLAGRLISATDQHRSAPSVHTMESDREEVRQRSQAVRPGDARRASPWPTRTRSSTCPDYNLIMRADAPERRTRSRSSRAPAPATSRRT